MRTNEREKTKTVVDHAIIIFLQFFQSNSNQQQQESRIPWVMEEGTPAAESQPVAYRIEFIF
jgi:hypothetical protein